MSPDQSFYTSLAQIVQRFRGDLEPRDIEPEHLLDTEFGLLEAVSAIHCCNADHLITHELLEEFSVQLLRRVAEKLNGEHYDLDGLFSEWNRVLYTRRQKLDLTKLFGRVEREFGHEATVGALQLLAQEALEHFEVDVKLGFAREPTFEDPGYTLEKMQEAIGDIADVVVLEAYLKIIDTLSSKERQ